MAQTERKTLK